MTRERHAIDTWMTLPLFPFCARHVEHAVCLVTTLVLVFWPRGSGWALGSGSAAVGALARGATCLYVCGLATSVEEVVVIPAAQRKERGNACYAIGNVKEHDGDSARSSGRTAVHRLHRPHCLYRDASNPGLALGSCVVPWVCLVLNLHWMLACTLLSTVIVLLWTGVFEGGGVGEGSGTTWTARGISWWILGWCTWQLYPDLMLGPAGLSFLWVSLAVGMFFFVRWLVPGTCTMGESVALGSAIVGVIGEGVRGVVHGVDHDMIGALVAAGLLSFIAALVWAVETKRKVGAGGARITNGGGRGETCDFRASHTVKLCISFVSMLGAGALAAPFLSRVPALVAGYAQDAASVYLFVYWAVCLAISVPGMTFLKNYGVRNIILRKGFHLLALLLFVPPLVTEVRAVMEERRVTDPAWGFRTDPHDAVLPMALAVALIVFLTLEIVRLGDIPLPFGMERHIHRFMSSFVDARDTQGELYVTHITLLLGLAVPIWLGSGWSAFAGIVMTGIGDALASVVGSLCGQRPIAIGTKKTVEGAAACLASMLMSWWVLTRWCEAYLDATQWATLAAATALSTLLESVTDSMDNIFVSTHYFCLVGCLCARS